MEILNHKVLGILSIFKKPYKISGADKLTVRFAIISLGRVLPGFFKCLGLGQPLGVLCRELPIKGNPKYSQRYLIVITKLSEVLGTQLYCRKLLGNDESTPIEQIYVIGQGAEVTLVEYIANYLHMMVEGIYRNTPPKHRGKYTSGKEYKKALEIEVYIGAYNLLQKYTNIRNQYTPKEGLQKRNERVLEYIKNYLKLDYNKNQKPGEPDIENARTWNGIFKVNKLLGTK